MKLDDDSIRSSSESEKDYFSSKKDSNFITKQNKMDDHTIIDKNENKNEKLINNQILKTEENELSEYVYLEILDQVLNSDYESPSIPEIILSVFKELFSD